MEDLKKVVMVCNDVATLQNVVSILLDGMETGMSDGCLFETLKQAYSELVDCHYTEEIAQVYFRYKNIDGKVWDLAKVAYEEVKATYPDVPVWDWVVLYGRMSLNNADCKKVVEACKVFLDNKFMPYYDIND